MPKDSSDTELCRQHPARVLVLFVPVFRNCGTPDWALIDQLQQVGKTRCFAVDRKDTEEDYLHPFRPRLANTSIDSDGFMTIQIRGLDDCAMWMG